MQEIIENGQIIENMIYEIRGKQVMLDRDLAKLYEVETRSLLQGVKRNMERFPKEFCFQMTMEEFDFWKSQIVMSKNDKKGLRRPPYVFTEQGVAMLAGVLKSPRAIAISIGIINTFVAMRRYFSSYLTGQEYVLAQVQKNTEDIKLLQESFKKFDEKKIVNEIYFNGQIYDAYSKLIDIFKEAKEELIIIDNYADKSVLDITRTLSCDVILITKRNACLSQTEINKYQKQYHNLTVVFDASFHDRYFIIDSKKVYHCGTSINHVGSKTFSINLLEDEVVKASLIANVSMLSGLSTQKSCIT